MGLTWCFGSGRFGSLPFVFRPHARSMRDQAVDAVIQRGTSKTVPRNLSFSGDLSATPNPVVSVEVRAFGRSQAKGAKVIEGVRAGTRDVQPRV